jgi:hypothetical protein
MGKMRTGRKNDYIISKKWIESETIKNQALMGHSKAIDTRLTIGDLPFAALR